MAGKLKRPDEKTFKKIVDDYFDECKGDKYAVPSKAGLRVRLGIHRDTYNEWKKQSPLSDAIKEAEDRIEEAWVKRLTQTQPTGVIFYLKNAFQQDYKDRLEHTGNDGGPMEITVIKYAQGKD